MRQSSRTRQFQSQTGSQALSDNGTQYIDYTDSSVSIPNGKPSPLRRGFPCLHKSGNMGFQSQTGSQALSDEDCQSALKQIDPVSIPNGKPSPLRQSRWARSFRRSLAFQSQ